MSSGILYGLILSPNYPRALVVAYELDIHLDHVFVNTIQGDQFKDDYKEKHVCRSHLSFFGNFWQFLSFFLVVICCEF